MSELILITGANGFIGRHATKYFRKKGFDVIGCCRTFYGDGGDHRQCDITDDEDVEFLFKHIKPKYILHLAGISSPKFNGEETLESNAIGTFNLINRCNDGAKVILASSVLVYGTGTLSFQKVEEDELLPESIYAVSKIAAENIVNMFIKQGKIKGVNLRLPAIVGSDLTHGMLIDFLRKSRNETALRPIGQFPGPSKPYLHIDDLLSAFELSLNLNGTYNVSTDDLLNVNQVAEIVLKTLKIDIPIEWGTSSTWKGDINCINVSSTKIKKEGWKNMYTSEEAIVRAIS